MLTKVDFEKKSKTVDPLIDCLNTYYGLNAESNDVSKFTDSKQSTKVSIIEHTIEDRDKKKFLVLLKLLMQAKESRHSHIINTIERMSQLLSIKDKNVQDFLK